MTVAEPATTTGPWWLVLALTLAGAGFGLVLMPRLADAGYRLDDESGPPPFPAWVVPVVLAAAWGGLVWRLGARAEFTLVPALLTFATAGVALAWIDADVHRLPTGLVLPAFGLVTAQLVLTSAVASTWGALIRALASALIFGVFFLLMYRFGPPGFGLGDVHLLALLALVTGYVSPSGPFTAAAIAIVLNGAWALAHVARGAGLRTQIAFGPWLVLGGYLTLLRG